MDDLDLAILPGLTEDSRKSTGQLADRLGVSAPTVLERMSRLERTGVITRYTAEINWAVLGPSQTVFVAVVVADRALVPVVLEQLWEIPEVESVSLVTGQWDLLMKLRVRDQRHMRSILIDRVWQLPQPNVNLTTMISMGEMPTKNVPHGIIGQLIADRARVS